MTDDYENRETRWPSTDDGSIGEHLAEARAVEDHQERKHAARERAAREDPILSSEKPERDEP